PEQGGATAVREGGRESATVLAWRLDGFNGPIRVEARELPPGVSCDPVVIGPGQYQAPIVFRAAEGAKPAVGGVRLGGQAPRGARKEFLDYSPRATVLRPEITREALAGEAVGPPGNANGQILPPPVRLTRGFVLAVREGAPFALTASPPEAVVGPDGSFELHVEVARRPGFVEAVALSATDLPPNMGSAGASIEKDKTS